jgi:preprotein translocase subunit Sec61beta
MARLFADENVPFDLVDALTARSHDVLTALAAGRANQGIPDPDVLAYATLLGRAVLTNNRLHFHKLHRKTPTHAGIISYTDDRDIEALAERIHLKIEAAVDLTSKLLKIYRPP